MLYPRLLGGPALMLSNTLHARSTILFNTEEQSDDKPYQTVRASISLPGRHPEYIRGNDINPYTIFPKREYNHTYKILKSVYAEVACKTFVTAIRHFAIDETSEANIFHILPPENCEDPKPYAIPGLCVVIDNLVVAEGITTARLFPANSCDVHRLLPLVNEDREWYIYAFCTTWKPTAIRDITKLESLPSIDVTQVAWPLPTSVQTYF